MANLKKDLNKACNDALEEIFDNYDSYNDGHKLKVQNIVNALVELANELECYDNVGSSKKKLTWWQKKTKEIKEISNAFFKK